jgi:uncharacterized membrane protein
MTFLLVLIVAIAFGLVISRHGARISELEKYIKKDSTVPSTPAPTPVSVSTQAPVQTNAVQTPINTEAESGGEEASGRLLGKLGIGALVIGIGFFLKYAIDNHWLSQEAQVVLAVIVGILFISLGVFIRARYAKYSDLLMGGGVAVLYLSIVAAYSFYSLISPGLGFISSILVTAISLVLSTYFSTSALSVIGAIGGFFSPLLFGIENVSQGVIYTYTVILNLGVLGISFFRSWQPLSFVSYIGTFVLYSAWHGSSIGIGGDLAFISIVFVVYNIVIFLQTSYQKKLADAGHLIMLIINALIFTSLAYDLMMPLYEDMLSIASFIVAMFFGALSLAAHKLNPEDKTLTIVLPGLAVTFLSIIVPLEGSGVWVPVMWFIEAVVLYLVASKASNRGYQIMGASVYVLGGIAYIWYEATSAYTGLGVPFFNEQFYVLLCAAGSAFIISYIYHKFGSITAEISRTGTTVFAVVGNIFLLIAGTLEIQKVVGPDSADSVLNTSVSIFWAIYAAFLTALGFMKRMSGPRRLGLVLFLVTALKVLFDVWSLGQMYRIVSFIVFGVIALAASFLYVKYSDRIKEIV